MIYGLIVYSSNAYVYSICTESFIFHMNQVWQQYDSISMFLAFCVQSSPIYLQLVRVYLEQLQLYVSPTTNFIALICGSIVNRFHIFWIKS